MPENNIVPSQSEAESLRLEIMRLRAEVLDLTAERDRLKYRVCPAILADYNRRIGQIELEIMEAVLRVRNPPHDRSPAGSPQPGRGSGL